MKLNIAIFLVLVFCVGTVLAILLVNLFVQQSRLSKQTSQNQLTTYTFKEVALHDNARDCWIIINENVYDVDRFLTSHPGGAERIINVCGQDATQEFSTQDGEGQHTKSANNQLDAYQIGILKL